MAQKSKMLAQKKPTNRGGNTIKFQGTTPRKARNWCFTLNNYTVAEIAQIFDIKSNLNLKQFCFQEEKGEDGTPHLQGVLAFINAISFNSIKKLSPRAHWEKCKSLKASLAYCSKADTRNGEIFTHNYTVYNEGKPLTDLDIYKELLKQRIKDIDLTGIKY